MKELWDVYDENRVKTGEFMERGCNIFDYGFHMVVHVCIFNSKGEMLIQQRQPFKKGWSNLWDVTVGGSAQKDDTSRQAAERETLEEIGYAIDLAGIRPSFTVNFEVGFDDYYLIEAEVDTNKLKVPNDEVQRVKWASKEEIYEMINNSKFVPYHKCVIEMCFNLRGINGAVKNSPKEN